MLGRVFRSGVFRFIAWVLIVALSLPIGLPLGFQKAEAADSLLVAVAGLENLTGRDILPNDNGIGAIIVPATRVEGIEIVPADRILSKLDGEPDKDTALAAGEAAGADMVLFGRVTELEFENDRNALVTVELYLYSAGKGGALLSRSNVTGSSGEKFGYEGDISRLADEALRNALDDSVEDLFANLSDFGMVTMSSDQGIYTDFTSGKGVTAGSELAVVRNYEQIATLKVEESKSSHTLAKLTDLKPGFQVEKGDKVRVLYKPQTVVKPSAKQQIKKKKKLSPIVIGVLAVGVIVALTRGKNKANDAVEQQRVYTTRSTDGVAYIYATNGFTTDYTPKTPQKKDINATTLNACYDAGCKWTGVTAASCSTKEIYTIDDSAYEYSLATNPKSSTLPSGWYIAVDMSKFPNAPGPTNTTNKVKFAQCNQTTGQWDLLSSSYGSNGTLKLSQAVSLPVTHFSPYVVVVDARPDPISAPYLSYTDCDESSIDLKWNQCTDADFKEYEVLRCDDSSSSTCNSSLTTKSGSGDLTYEVTGLASGVEYCHAVRVNSITGLRNSSLSNVLCVTPGPECEIPPPLIGEITLLSPEDGAQITISQPDFVFMGSGDSDKYILNLRDVASGTVIFTETIDGEGSGSSGERETYSGINYSGQTLIYDRVYGWMVTGINETTGINKESNEFTFTYKAGGVVDVTTCDPSNKPGKPTLVTPQQGAQIAVAKPTFQWEEVLTATSYTITVQNEEGYFVYQKNVKDNIDTTYDGDTLQNNETYTWMVMAHTDCAAGEQSDPWSFMKVDTSGAPLPAPEWVDPATDGKSPITQIDGGDQYIVRLYWRQVPGTTLNGYKVYRCDTQEACSSKESATLLAVIFENQLSAPPPNANCGTFSDVSPGYCDISAENGRRHFYIVTAFDNTQQESYATTPQNILLNLKRPNLISPGGVSSTEPGVTKITNGEPLFTWQEVPGYDVSYILRVTNQSSGMLVWETTVGSSGVSYGGTTALVNENTYSWTVTAFNNLVESDSSLTFYFKKKASATKPSAPLWCDDADATKCAAHPSFYEINYTRNSITLYWEKVSGSDIQEYYVYRATSESGLPDSDKDSGNQIGTAQNNDCGTLADIVCYEDRGSGAGLDRGEYYYYALKTVDSGGTTSNPSKTRSVLNYALVGAQLIYPYNNQMVFDPQPQFEWLKELGADQYRIEVEPSDGTWSAADLYWVKILTGTTAIYGEGEPPPRMPLENPANPSNPNKTYHWRVCSINENYPTGKCDGSVYKFTKWLKQPTPQYPTSGERVTTNDITFSWSASPGAFGYELRVFYESGGNEIVIKTAKVTGEFTTQWAMTGVQLQVGVTYYWKIRAYDEFGAVSGQWSLISDKPSFQKVDSQNPIPMLPSNNQIIGPNLECGVGVDGYGNNTYNYEIDFSWTSAGSSVTYKVKVEEEVEAPKLSFVTVWEITLTNTTQKVNANCAGLGGGGSNVIPFSPGRMYRWNVAVVGNAYADTNAKYFFTGLPAPLLQTPFNGSEVVILDDCDGLGGLVCTHFDWDVVYGAGRYEIEIVSDNEYYRCEPGNVPTVATGTTSVNTSSCDMSTATVDNEDLFQWRVRARDSNGEPNADGNPGPWSPYWSFTVLIPPPVLSSPPNSTPDPGGCPSAAQSHGGDVLGLCTTVPCQDPSFYWSPIPVDPACYKIQLSDTEDFRNIIFEDNNSTGNYVNKCTTTCTWGNCCHTSPDDPVPMVNGVAHYWRVGASVPKGVGNCGESWVYSEPYIFYKRPPSVPNVSFKDLDYNTVTITWFRPTNCDGDPTKMAESTPIVPDNPNSTLAAYLIYQDDELVGRASWSATEWTPPAGAVQESTDYTFCVAVRDNSGVENWPGSVSDKTCVFLSTPADPAGG